MSIIVGYPIADREADLAYEAESARLWEAQQPEPEVKPLTGCSFDTLNDAHAPLIIALDGFNTIETYLDEAIAAIHDTPEADKLASVSYSFLISITSSLSISFAFFLALILSIIKI